MSVNLTANAIPAIINGDVDAKPLVQVIDIVLLVTSNDSLLRRYCLTLSDGVSSYHATLDPPLNHRVITGQVKKGSIVQLLNYICTPLPNHKIIIVLNMETIQIDCPIIGNPKSCVVSEFVENLAPTPVIPIAALNPYHCRWAIKARVTAKGDLRYYNNYRGNVKFFSFDLLDADGGEVQVNCLNDAVDSFFDVIEAGKVYLISKGRLKPGHKKFNHLKNKLEIMLDLNSKVELSPDDDGSIPRHQFSFRSISDIENVESNTILDVIGIVTSVSPSILISRENALEMRKRILNLKDSSGRSVELTLWSELCNREGQELQKIVDAGDFPILAVKGGKVNEFRGKSIDSISTTRLFVNPDFHETQSLIVWFDQGGKDSASPSISRDITYRGFKNEIRKTVSQIKDEGSDWITMRATIFSLKTDVFCYTACPLIIGDQRCNKKVTRSGQRCTKKVTMSANTSWKCDRCNQEFDDCDYRYILQAQILDHTGLTWVTAFDEAGKEIMGYSAKDLYALKYEKQEDEMFGDIIKSILYNQFVFRLKIQEELYGKEQNVKIAVVKAEKVNYSAESRYMLDLISKFCRQ